MINLDVQTLEHTFNALAPKSEELTERFYEELFKRQPAIKPLFKNTGAITQRQKLFSAIRMIIDNLRKPEMLKGALTELGARHRVYGAKPEYYEIFAETLVDVMAEMGGELWTPQVRTAWSDALNAVIAIMQGTSVADQPKLDRTG